MQHRRQWHLSRGRLPKATQSRQIEYKSDLDSVDQIKGELFSLLGRLRPLLVRFVVVEGGGDVVVGRHFPPFPLLIGPNSGSTSGGGSGEKKFPKETQTGPEIVQLLQTQSEEL